MIHLISIVQAYKQKNYVTYCLIVFPWTITVHWISAHSVNISLWLDSVELSLLNKTKASQRLKNSCWVSQGLRIGQRLGSRINSCCSVFCLHSVVHAFPPPLPSLYISFSLWVNCYLGNYANHRQQCNYFSMKEIISIFQLTPHKVSNLKANIKHGFKSHLLDNTFCFSFNAAVKTIAFMQFWHCCRNRSTLFSSICEKDFLLHNV